MASVAFARGQPTLKYSPASGEDRPFKPLRGQGATRIDLRELCVLCVSIGYSGLSPGAGAATGSTSGATGARWRV